MADKIQARAIQRCGELLQELAPKATPGKPANCKGDLTITRTRAAEDAGFSVHQKRTALRIANVPAEQFEQAVESEEPPTITELADAGKKPLPVAFR